MYITLFKFFSKVCPWCGRDKAFTREEFYAYTECIFVLTVSCVHFLSLVFKIHNEFRDTPLLHVRNMEYGIFYERPSID